MKIKNWKLEIISRKFSLVTLALVVFVATNIISALLSPYPYTAIWGYYSRFSGGLVSILCYGTIFFILRGESKTTLRTVLATVLITSGLVSIYGVAQHFGLEEGRWVQDVTARVFSSFGQPNWLAAFLVLVLPLNLYFLMAESDRRKKIILTILTVLNFSALWFTFSVSGISAFAICFLLFVVFLDKKTRAQNWPWLLLVTSLWIFVCLWQPGLARARFEDAADAISKRLSLTVTAYAAEGNFKVGDTGDIRLILWPGVLPAALSSPKNFLLGTGPETFAYSFLPWRPAAMNNTSESGFLYNKAHNYFLDLLINTGLLGLSAYLFLNTVALVTAFKRRKNVLSLAVGSALAGNIITNFFGWPTVTTNLIFVLYLAILSGKNYD